MIGQTLMLASLLALVGACSSSQRPAKTHPDADTGPIGSDGTPVTTRVGPSGEVLSGDSDGTPLALVPDSGNEMRFLDARALTKLYANVFAKKDFGYMHCSGGKPREESDCTESIFTKDERPSMGSFDLGSPRMGRAPQNVNPPVNLTLNYTRTL